MTQTERTYAQALYSLAKDEALTADILEQLNMLRRAFEEESDFVRLLSAPNIPKEQRCAVLDGSFRGKLHPYVLNFLKILTERGYVRRFADCCRAYEDCYNADHGILPVQAVSAVALTGEQTRRLEDKLSALTGKSVKLLCRVDPQVLGGVRLSYDGKQVDGTVRGRLDKLGTKLKNTVIEVS